MKKAIYIKRTKDAAVYAFIALTLFGVSAPYAVHAGVFSFLSGNKAEKEEVSANSQTVALLQAEPVLDPTNAQGGADITIEDSALLPESDSPLVSEIDLVESDQISLYVVREGDTISQIAKMFSVSVNTIRWANELSSKATIKEGQTLVILPVNGVKYAVKKGDTLKSIASAFKGDIDEIARFNGIPSDTAIAVGTELIIPNGEIFETKKAPSASSKNPDAKTIARYSGPEYKGYYIRPIVGGRRSQGVHGNNGVDLAAPTGTPIVASASGTVLISRNSGWNGGYGKYVVIKHDNGTQTLYGHMNETAISAGAYVTQGQLIGYLGNTGRSTGPHVHFEIRGAKNPF